MSIPAPIALTERHADTTHRLILSCALELLEAGGVAELTVRAVAKRAGMSERTIFRYFATRDEFLDAIAKAAGDAIGPPPPPGSLAELPAYVETLYGRFEDCAPLVRSALHTEIYERMRESAAARRWRAVEALLLKEHGGATAGDLVSAKANLQYYLSATTWHYFRYYLGLSFADTVIAAARAVRLVVADLASPGRLPSPPGEI